MSSRIGESESGSARQFGRHDARRLLVLALAQLLTGCGRDEGTSSSSAALAPTGIVPRLGGPSWDKLDDPKTDGWDSEVFASNATAQLKLAVECILDPSKIDTARLASLADDAFASDGIFPEALETAFEDRLLRVERAWIGREPATPGPSSLRRGPGGLGGALRDVANRVGPLEDPRFEAKVFRVLPGAADIATRAYIALWGKGRGGFVELHATWVSTWARGADGAAPKLRSLGALDLELTTRSSPGPLLAECTPAVLGKNASYAAQILHGLNHWAERLQDNRFFALLGTPGLAVGDVNSDGLDDLYLCQEGGLPNKLFVANADGTATDASAGSGIDWLDSTRSALLLDLDNDGDQDLAAAVLGAVVFAAGDGKAHFEVKTAVPTSNDTMSLAAADYDDDGDLDLYVCAYKEDDLSQDAGVLSIGASADFVYHDANSGARNYLLRNDGAGAEWRFTDATVETGMDANNRRFSFAAAWEDFDGDGDQDLYVANDFGRKNLYRNDGPRGAPRFVDAAATLGAEDSASGMGITWGDYDRDGWPDAHVSNMFSSAGSRVTYQALFKPEATGEVRARLQRFALGDTLLRNRGGKGFDDVSDAAAITMARWGWSSNFIDLNNDGWEDLVVANGYITTEDTGDL